ncbi:WD40-repeat-containing domain protein [Limtongia smithiae]|uniref:WD40-repeat-containing domain protein n=1 Tax=Limtongia smithiae TaxID=1125753 RepID=UPI0034CEA9E1
MVKSYLRFEPDASFGIIAANSNVLSLPPVADATGSTTKSAGKVVTGALESVLVWDLKTGERLAKWNELEITTEVTCIANYGEDVFAVGYSDGSIRVWDAKTETVLVRFSGHRSAISALKFDESGTILASGSRDSNILIWDLISETGKFRLRSHKDEITGLEFLPVVVTGSEDDVMKDAEAEANQWLVSVSKDGYIKLWDLSTQHCVETHIAHKGECWALAVNSSVEWPGLVLMTAGGESEIKVWKVDVANPDGKRMRPQGTLLRQSKSRAVTIRLHPSAPYFAVHGTDKAVEIWRIRTEKEVRKSVARKQKRRREKLAAKGVQDDEDEDKTKDADAADDVSEVYVRHVVVRTSARVRSVDWALTPGKDSIHVVASLTSNCVEAYTISAQESGHKKSKNADVPEYSQQYSLNLPGHRTDVRAVAISSDDRMVASASNGSVKIWNEKTTNCIRTFECGYALCMTFLPGDSIVVVGTKSGEIEMFDVASASLIERVDAHEGAVWSLAVTPDGKTLVTASADKTLRFFEFKVVQDVIPGTTRTVGRMSLKERRRLQLTDDVLAVSVSRDGKYVAASLLDSTVKVFFYDTLKFFLSLYGHKLPVLGMDISDDSKLLVTCSADKNIKIWGLDFGDCHRSIFAHEDSVMAVRFVPGSHCFFSAGKDGAVKYWDGDKFENIQRLDGHKSEVWALAIASSGQFVVTSSHDKSVRIWQQTEEEMFLEEEREKEMESLYESQLVSSLDAGDGHKDIEGDEDEAAAGVGRQTAETVIAGERITEALELGRDDIALITEHAAALKKNPQTATPARNIVFSVQDNISAERYVLNVVERTAAAELEDALLLLRFEHVQILLSFVEMWATRGWNVALGCRVVSVLLRAHYRQLVATGASRAVLARVRTGLRGALRRAQEELAHNVAGLKYVRRAHEEEHAREYMEGGGGEETVRKRVFSTL